MPPRIHITSSTSTFDTHFIQDLQSEGFDVTYLPFHPQNSKTYRTTLSHLADDLEFGESYAIIAFGAAARDCLDFHLKPQPNFAALICYYPSEIPQPKATYPSQLQVLCHLAGDQGFAPAFRSYVYKHAKIGFAENDSETFDKTAAELSWTRTLGVLRKAFKIDVGQALEGISERHGSARFVDKAAEAVIENVTADAYVNHVPTMTGGIGQKDLFLFYRHYFIPQNPPSLSMRLVSRTTGVDRVVDEMVLSFKHTQEVPWLLPGVQPTNKVVHIALVSIVCIRGGKLYHEHVYWDQASVLVQVGLLDPRLVPGKFREEGLERLPVLGSETAAKVLDEGSEPYNELIVDSTDGESASAGALPMRPKQAANKGQANST